MLSVSLIYSKKLRFKITEAISLVKLLNLLSPFEGEDEIRY